MKPAAHWVQLLGLEQVLQLAGQVIAAWWVGGGWVGFERLAGIYGFKALQARTRGHSSARCSDGYDSLGQTKVEPACKVHGARTHTAPRVMSACGHPPQEPFGFRMKPVAHLAQLPSSEQRSQLAGQGTAAGWIDGGRPAWATSCVVYWKQIETMQWSHSTAGWSNGDKPRRKGGLITMQDA